MEVLKNVKEGLKECVSGGVRECLIKSERGSVSVEVLENV